MKGSKRRFLLSVVCAVALVLCFSPLAMAVTAQPTTAQVLIDGEPQDFVAYNIDGNNYFKLRDLAYALNGTPKQFNVVWDQQLKAITIQPLTAYVPVGGEMEKPANLSAKTVSPAGARLYLGPIPLDLTAYNIDDNNFFKLRDILSALNIAVSWNEAAQTISISTSAESGDASGKLPAPAGLYVYSCTEEHIGIQWDEVPGADGYYVFYTVPRANNTWYHFENADGSWMLCQHDDDYSAGLYIDDPDIKYSFKVTAVKNGVQSDYSEILSVRPSAWEGPAQAETGRYPASEHEPNDLPSTADDFSADAIMHGHLGMDGTGAAGNYMDTYKITCEERGTLTIVLSGDSLGKMIEQIDLACTDEKNRLLNGSVFRQAGVDGEYAYMFFELDVEPGDYYLTVSTKTPSLNADYTMVHWVAESTENLPG